MHPLTAYCERHDIRLYHLARRMFVADTTLSRLVRHERRPSPELMTKIEVATGGEVSVAELFAAHYMPHRQIVGQGGTKHKSPSGSIPPSVAV